jgi:hypothetical protein
MVAAYDSEAGRVYFGVESTDLSDIVSNNNAAFILDLAATQSGSTQGGVFTTRTGAAFQPTALHYDSKNKRMLIGDYRGYVFTFDATLYNDPAVDTLEPVYANWARDPIVWDYMGVHHHYGSSRSSKRMSGVYFTAKNITGDLSINAYSYKDDRATPKTMRIVRERDITTGLHKIKYNYPKYHLNKVYDGIQLKKGYVVIARSDDHALVTTNTMTDVATLLTGNFPNDGDADLRGHTLWLGPNYTRGYTILIHSGNAVLVNDNDASFPTSVSGLEWVIMGYPKGESVEFDVLDHEFNEYVEGYPERAGDGDND